MVVHLILFFGSHFIYSNFVILNIFMVIKFYYLINKEYYILFFIK